MLAGKRDRPYPDGRYREAARPSGQPEYTEHSTQPTDVPPDYGFQPNLSRPSKTSNRYLPTRKTTGIENHLRSGTLCCFAGFHILPAITKRPEETTQDTDGIGTIEPKKRRTAPCPEKYNADRKSRPESTTKYHQRICRTDPGRAGL